MASLYLHLSSLLIHPCLQPKATGVPHTDRRRAPPPTRPPALRIAQVVVTDASLPEDVAQVVQDKSVAAVGLTPSLLAAIPPAHIAPPVRLLFTWGEALAEEVVARWRAHSPPVVIRDLLISTEYWLCLYSGRESPGPAVFRPLPGLCLLPDPGAGPARQATA